MGWKVWLLRTVVCSLCVAAGVLSWFAYQHTNSEAVRRTLIEQIEAQFQGVDVEIGSAWLRPLGGISVRDLRLKRRDDPSHPFLLVPAASIFHDKEQLAQGRLVIRKIELQQPEYLLRRDMDGNWNLSDVVRTGKSENPLPLLVIRNGTIRYEDRSIGGTRPTLEISGLNATAVNDPVNRVTFQGNAATPLGPVKWSGNWRRDQNLASVSVELTGFVLEQTLVRDLGKYIPEIADHLTGLEAKGDAKLELRYQPGTPNPWKPDLSVNFRHGRFRHPKLPLPLEGLEVKLRYRDDQVTVERCIGRSGATKVSVTLDSAIPPAGMKIDDPEQLFSFLNLSVQNLTLSKDLFAHLPDNLKKIHARWQPKGPVSLTYEYRHNDKFWSRRCTVHPEGMDAQYERFPYRLRDLRGTVDQHCNSQGLDRLTIDLKGKAAERTVVIAGQTDGEGDRLSMDLTVSGTDLPIDATLLAAMGKYRAAVESFKPVGAGDFHVTFHDRPGNPETEVKARIEFRRLTVCADAFPYPLEDMTGTLRLVIGARTRLEFQNFRGRHNGGEISLDGSDEIGSAANVLGLTITGAGVPFDADLARAVSKLKLQSTWKAIGPRGRMNFTARLSHIDRAAPPNLQKPPGEIEVVIERLHADAIVPDFLPYELGNVSLALRYANNRVKLTDFQGTHGPSRVRISEGEILAKPCGGMWGQFQNIQFNPLIVDDELLIALPTGLRNSVTALEPSGAMALAAGRVIVDLAPDPPNLINAIPVSRNAVPQPAIRPGEPSSPWIYWENVVFKFSGASLKCGVRFETVFGELGSRGEYRDGRVGAVDGNLEMTQATLFHQPLQNVHAQLVMDPARAPGVLQVRNIKGNVYGGSVSGQGRLIFEPTLRYDVILTGLQMKLEEIARINRFDANSQLSGKAMMQLYLVGQGNDLANLRGEGHIDVPKGRIYDLPPLLDLLKFLKLRTPDGTAFEEAHARFKIQGKRIHFDELDLVGGLVNVTGDGNMNLDGSDVKLDVYPIWSRVVQALPAQARDFPASVSRGLYKIEMRGELGGQLDFSGHVVPVIAEPMKRLRAKMGQ